MQESHNRKSVLVWDVVALLAAIGFGAAAGY